MSLFQTQDKQQNHFMRADRTPFLVVGLGNPGKEYEQTRHNAGFMAVEQALQDWNLDKPKLAPKFKAKLSQGRVGDEDVFIMEPLTFMNASGQSIRAVMDYYKIPDNHLLVVSDDIDLPFGSLRSRQNGASGGHHGLDSVKQHQTVDFARVRIGVSNELRTHENAPQFVLSPFSKEEADHLPIVLQEAVRMIETFIYGAFTEETVKTKL